MKAKLARLWGAQYPFERNHLQRTMTLIGLGGVFAVTIILLVRANITNVLGTALIGGGVVCALAAVSRYQYLRETSLGFAILETRGGLFVLGSALGLAVVGVLVALLIFLR
ncbi:hypothetical protein [Mycobacterium vicinigordonae]|uniref:Uncharacterized protein n=1 Tax=Mycobacterium vicinigordonae TaxID=1719132 RepID=A0A7D6HWB7_9MYCO|nr:hypothetical protein [Mycobacterium vicinigordonae]QLL06015.1 hypothetical protein H0P51_19825 [Mycobacterium vicinigordonae]